MARPQNFDTDTVLDRAMDQFWTHGYANTSPAQLAEATGIGKGSLYNTFGSKRALFDIVLDRYGRLGTGLAEDYMSRPGTTRECLREYLRAAVDLDLASPTRRGCLAVNTAAELGGHDAAATATLRGIEQRIVAVLAARIDQGRRDGDVDRDVDPNSIAALLFTTSAGLRLMAKTNDAAQLYRLIDVVLTTL
ncbi:TetR/AcrR family transcriptional regulator [Nocardia alba]|uniref:TetR family transcriptional regulator n=1 Tax=Nocardia alba TaxID=225051 RepID=A0A4R1FZK2_9NOCA|nr:TetR/AcrR family transcriptional regulator [Nocardia alba]TCJ96771.1 TetR family transcriptional regulator [Nocardia alba]